MVPDVYTLTVYACMHSEMGYAEGMNDILARFLVMTESEVDSYCLFKQYMERKKEGFPEETMMTKVGEHWAVCVLSERSECDRM